MRNLDSPPLSSTNTLRPRQATKAWPKAGEVRPKWARAKKTVLAVCPGLDAFYEDDDAAPMGVAPAILHHLSHFADGCQLCYSGRHWLACCF
jgi:hypothetical protein